MSDRWLFAILFETNLGRVEKSLTQNGWNAASRGTKTLGSASSVKILMFAVQEPKDGEVNFMSTVSIIDNLGGNALILGPEPCILTEETNF
jgi:hypothetical protein